MTMADGPRSERPQTSTRDYDQLRAQLEAWLQERVPGATVSELIVPESNGMSSETVLFDLTVPGQSEPRGLVARIAPDPEADPVFPTYDMERQFRTMQMVAEHTEVPVPTVLWLENGTEVIGAPFFVMERIDGEVPGDQPHWRTAGFVFDARSDRRKAMWEDAVGVLAALHQVDASQFPFHVHAPLHASKRRERLR